MDTIKITKTFNAPLSDVWNAITTSEIIKIWSFNFHNFTLEVGNEFYFYDSEETQQHYHACTILKVENERVFEHTWAHPKVSKGTSTVSWTLTGNDTETTVLFTHEGTETFADAGADFSVDNFKMGWNALIGINLRNFLHGIERLTFNIDINASAPKVWNSLWNPINYSDWTKAFCDGSSYEGELSTGNRIHFLDGNHNGMYSDLIFYTENKLAIFSHIGEIKEGTEAPINAQMEAWTGSLEMYTVTEKEQCVDLKIEVDCISEYIDFMNDAFSKAISRIKELSESH